MMQICRTGQYKHLIFKSFPCQTVNKMFKICKKYYTYNTVAMNTVISYEKKYYCPFHANESFR